MRARDIYERRREPAPPRGTRWRRPGQLVALIVDRGPVPGGGGRTLVVEKATGSVAGEVEQPFGDDIYDARLEEDLLTLAADDFNARWLLAADS